RRPTTTSARRSTNIARRRRSPYVATRRTLRVHSPDRIVVRTLFAALALLAATLVAAAPPPVAFTDVTTASGIGFTHNNGAFGKKYLPETLGSGALFLDEDGDGWQDILLINSKSWPGHRGPTSLPALYRNRGNGTFTDITRGSGLDIELY